MSDKLDELQRAVWTMPVKRTVGQWRTVDCPLSHLIDELAGIEVEEQVDVRVVLTHIYPRHGAEWVHVVYQVTA